MKSKRLRPFLLVFAVLFLPIVIFAQSVTVTGKVIDNSTGTSLEGATIRIKNSKISTVSDTKGNFSIKAPSSESVITITYIGYGVYESKAGNGVMNVELKNLNTGLNDVIVVAYGTQKRSHLTGSVGSVDMKTIEDLPVGSLSEALKNQIVGVNVNGGFKRPGEAASITIRNPVYYSKDGGSKDPIYVIDDIIRDKSDFDLLDASEVENISVLKDAAAAIYGIIGSNGVILVKTKRGKSGLSSINYSSSIGTSYAPYLPKMLSGYDQAVYLNDYSYGQKDWDLPATEALATYYTQDELDFFKTVNYNWLKDALQNATETRHALNISGGSDRATFFAGFSYNSQNSNFDGLGFKRYSFRSSSDIKVANGLKLGLSVSANFSDKKNTFNKQGGESLDNDWKTLVGEARFNPPYINGLPILIPNAGTGSNINTYHYFAVHDLNNYTSSQGTSVNFQGQLSYDFPFLKGLRAAVNFNKNISNSWGKQYGTKYNVYDFNRLGTHNHILDTGVVKKYTWSNGNRVRLNPSIDNTYQLNYTVNYDKIIGRHQFNVLFGYEQVETKSNSIAGMQEGVVVGGLDNMNFATGTQSASETISEGGRMAYFGRLDYSFANKYLLQFSIRADASVNFAPENRWGYFPSLSAGWVISEENFFRKETSIFSFLKLRASAGWLGLDATKSYQWLRSYAIQTGKAAIFGGNADRGLAVVTNTELANRDVHWDNVDKYNVGIDARTFNNRLSLSIDGFLDKRSDMLTALTSAPSILIGAAIPSENYSRLNNFGYELAANWNDKISKDWSYFIGANFDWNSDKVLLTDYPVGNTGTYLDPIGRPSDMGYLGYRSLGILRTQEQVDNWLAKYPNYKIFNQPLKPGMLYFQDVRGPKDASGKYTVPDGTITNDDLDYLSKKQGNPYGLGLNWGISYKSISFRVSMGMSWGGTTAVEGAAIKAGKPYLNRPAFWADHWTPDNPDAKYPSPFYTFSYDVPTDFWWRSSFTCSVNNFNLSYSLPHDVLNKIKINNARIFLVGINPLNLFNPFDYKDNANSSYNVFPQLRSYSIGLNVNL